MFERYGSDHHSLLRVAKLTTNSTKGRYFGASQSYLGGWWPKLSTLKRLDSGYA